MTYNVKNNARLQILDDSSVSAEIAILGDDFPTEDLTRTLGIIPTKVWNIGDEIRKTGYKHSDTCWTFNVGAKEMLNADEALKKLIAIFKSKADVLCDWQKKYNLLYTIGLVVIIEKRKAPAICLNNDVIQFAAKIAARIDVDVYVNPFISGPLVGYMNKKR